MPVARRRDRKNRTNQCEAIKCYKPIILNTCNCAHAAPPARRKARYEYFGLVIVMVGNLGSQLASRLRRPRKRDRFPQRNLASHAAHDSPPSGAENLPLRYWLITLIIVFVTLLLYGLLLLPTNRSLYTVTQDISLGTPTEGADGIRHLSQEELNQLIHDARADGMVARAIDQLEVTDRIREAAIEDIKIVAIVDQQKDSSAARIVVCGSSRYAASQVNEAVRKSLLRFVASQTQQSLNASRLGSETSATLSATLLREATTYGAVHDCWSQFQGAAQRLANSAPRAAPQRAEANRQSDTPLPATSTQVRQSELVQVNPDWLDAERRLRELRSERARLTALYPLDRNLSQRLEGLVHEAEQRLTATQMYLPPESPFPVNALPHSAVADPVTVERDDRPREGGQDDAQRADADTADWLDLVSQAQERMTPAIELHHDHREQLMQKIREALPIGSTPRVFIGWVESAPQVVKWGRAIAPRRFAMLGVLCLILAGFLATALTRMTALERIHDLRELTANSPIPVIAAVGTGVIRPRDSVTTWRSVARWTRRLFQLALLLYLAVFLAAALTPGGSFVSFLDNPREMLSQAYSLFSSVS